MGLLDRLGGIFAQRQTSDQRIPTERRIPITYRTVSGIVVTADNAPQLATVWACLRYLSQSVAILPWHVYRPVKDGGELARSHPIDQLISSRPSPEWSSFQFRESMTHWALRWGNGYAEIERDPVTGRIIGLHPLHPSRVLPMRDHLTQKLFYRVWNGNWTSPLPTGGPATAYADLQPEEIYHVRGFGEGPVGVNVMEYAAESLGWARAAQLFGAGFFGSGMNPGGVVTSKKSISEPALKRLKASFAKMYKGVRSDRTMFLDDSMEYKPITMEPEKAQFIATNEYLVDEICRWFGVPPHKVAKLLRSTNNNIEYQSIEVVTDSIAPWVVRFEQEADYKLFGPQNRPNLYTRMDMTELLRGDAQGRATFYGVMRQWGVFSANDVLKRENMPLISAKDGGDKRIVQSQYTTLDQIGEQTPQALQPKPAKRTDANDPGNPNGPNPGEKDDPSSDPPPMAPAPPTSARRVEEQYAIDRLRVMRRARRGAETVR